MAPTAQGDDDPQVTNPQPQEPSTSTPEISEGAGPSSSTNGNNEKKPSNRAKKKRAREGGATASSSRDERDAAERQNYYQRLLHSCTKHVRKCLKEAKGLECTKLARQLKKQGGGGGGGGGGGAERRRSDGNDGEGGSGEEQVSDSDGGSDDERVRAEGKHKDANPPSASSLHKLENRYRQMKALEVEPAVAVVLKRLGILNLDPNHATGGGRAADASAPTAATTTATADGTSDIVERLLRHGKVRTCMEKWNDQVTEYRRWCLRQDEMRNAGGGGGKAKAMAATVKGKASNSKRRRTARGASAAAEAATTAASFQHSVFARLGAGESDDSENDGGSDSNDDDFYGSGGGGTNKSKEKKNRPGQRARKAKAEAIRAKEHGVTRTTQSLNWREPKTKAEGVAAARGRQRSSAHDGDAPRGPKSHPVAAANRVQPTPAQDDKAHPSWQAKSLKSNTGGIVAFQGTKITFD